MSKKSGSGAFGAAYIGILGAVALAVSFLEHIVCSALPLPPGIKPGFSNIVIMFCCSSAGFLPALCIALLKSGFALLVNGAVSGLISLCGGVLSCAVTAGLLKIKTKNISYTGISVVSAVFHNGGQLLAACLVTGSGAYVYYAPVLVVSAVASGALTGIILTAVMPQIIKHGGDKNGRSKARRDSQSG